MKKKLIIHIGTPKTGTTSIQNTLYASRLSFMDYGLYYPKFLPHDHIYGFTSLFKDDPENLIFFRQKDLKSDQMNEKQTLYKNNWIKEFETFQGHCFIISAEKLSELTIDEVRKVKNFVEQYFEEIEIIVYVRPFNALIPSAIQESIKGGFVSSSFEDLFRLCMNDKNHWIFYSNSIKSWINIFGRESVTVRPFNKKAFKNNDLIDDFLETIGYGEVDTRKIKKFTGNESIGKYSVTLLSKLNQRFPMLKNGELNKERGLVNSWVPTYIFSSVHDEKFTLDIKYTISDAELLNKEIDYINEYLPQNHRFDYVKSSNELTVFPKIEEIPINFYVDLLNEYHKEIEKYLKVDEFYQDLFDLIGFNKSIFIWGAGSAGIKVLNLLSKLNLTVSGFIDSDSRKIGNFFHDFRVFAPNEVFLKFKKEEVFFIVGSSYYNEITKELVDNGFKEKENYIVKHIY
ncbi:hypothetical protein CD30_13600 [Ureibacillus massiliensis 4400831 = CIP 108448 = CCUG 49529]|uniref:Sulfotransferase domain-containing protein n=1 Tax=Ureibacillus massiliensis 4400831 = CIP 108448 = CCUG 49529 TaxID=1211035 RepID=A0A0A3J4J1_9BACL|nr:hypothetical protein [Ureibacillus massiliensis]KGR90093.1 hypothetical protein CD30_13600 [Ureibacillus massiliensis 4400831 = CIP 108448 = CCUG 49529]